MDLPQLVLINRLAIYGVCFFGIFAVICTAVMHVTDKKIAYIYRQQETGERKNLQNEIHRIRKSTDRIDDRIVQFIEKQAIEEKEEEHALRLSAFDKYNNNQLLEALTEINKAISLVKDNAKNYLLRGYIYAALYENFTPGNLVSIKDETRNKYSNEWYQQGVSDYWKAIELTKDSKPDLFIEASVRLAYFKAQRAFHSDEKTANKLYAEAQKELDNLLSNFTDNEKIATFIKLIKQFQEITNTDLGIT